MKRSELKKQAKAALKGKWGIAILIGLVYIAISYVAGSIPGASLVTPVFAFGFAAFYLAVTRGGEAKFEMLFTESFSNFLKKWGAVWLKTLYLLLWYLLFIIPGVVKSYSYAMTDYILLDNPEMGVNEAITESRRMMNGYKWKLFVLDLSFIGWRLLCLIPVVGTVLNVLYLTPYIAATKAQFYEELKKVNG